MAWTTKDLAEVYRNRGEDPLSAVMDAGASKRTKYNSRKKEIDGHLFDSTKEARRYECLKAMQQVRQISDLQLQPVFLLQEGFRTIGRHWCRPIHYRADFSYLDREGNQVVEDVKSAPTKTQAYRIKVKLFQQKYPDITFVEVE